MAKPPNNGNTKEESVNLTPEKVKALLEHLESTEQLTNQALINAEVLLRDAAEPARGAAPGQADFGDQRVVACHVVLCLRGQASQVAIKEVTSPALLRAALPLFFACACPKTRGISAPLNDRKIGGYIPAGNMGARKLR